MDNYFEPSLLRCQLELSSALCNVLQADVDELLTNKSHPTHVGEYKLFKEKSSERMIYSGTKGYR